MNLMSRLQIKGIAAKSLVALGGCVAATALLLGRAGAEPQVDECAQSGKNCTFTISNNSIQKVPTLFKLQAQISQAKVPLGEAVFPFVVVKLKNGNAELCKEEFPQVQVNNGVLNLEIGRNVQGCQMDDVVAKYTNLAFQVCIGSSPGDAGNCLKPIQMSSVPYAVKANFASQAQESYRSELAARAHYAQRVTADGAMLQQQQLGAGYYDFETPAAAKIADLKAVYGPGEADVKGGFLQWAAVDPANRTLNVSAKNTSTNALLPLSKFLLHATDTGIWGTLNVVGRSTFVQGLRATGPTSTLEGGVTVSGGIATMTQGLSVSNGATLSGGATVNGPATLTGGATVTGLATMNTGLTVANGITATSGTVDVQTSATFGAVAGGSTLVAFRPGTTVDMSAATEVKLPSTVTAAPAITVTETVSNSASGCLDAQAPIGAKFCGISSSQQVSTTSGSCKVLVISGRYTLRACSAFCSARCF